MVDFVPSSAAGALAVLPEDEIPGLKLALLDLHVVDVTVVGLIGRTSPKVSAKVGIDLIDRPTDATGAVELIVALRSEHIRRSEL